MAKAKQKKTGKKLSGNPLLVLVLISGAFYVNWVFIKGYLPFDVFQGKGGAQGEQGMDLGSMNNPKGMTSSPSPGSVAAYQPVSLDEEVPNPFGALISNQKPSQEKVDPENSFPSSKREDPLGGVPKGVRLSLVLLSGKSRSAVIGGKIVGLGDKLSFGVVQVIENDHVEILGEGGRSLVLPLRKAPFLVHVGKKTVGSQAAEPSSKPVGSTRTRTTSDPGSTRVPSVPQGPMNPTDFLKVLQGFTPPSGQGKE